MVLQLIAAVVLGFVWLYEKHYFLHWILFGFICSLLAFLTGLVWSSSRAKLPELDVKGEEHWSNLEKKAFEEVESYSSTLNYEEYDFKKIDDVLSTIRGVLSRVAAVYHPDRKKPEYDVSLALVLLLFERVIHDLRLKLGEEIPGTYLLTIKDILRMQTLYTMYRPLYNWYRVISFPLNPFSAVVRETRAQLNKQAVGAFGVKLRQMFFRYLFKLVGYYSVELYSGRLHFEDAHGTFSEFIYPLNFLVLGQSSSGKSTFAETLFAGEHVKKADLKVANSQVLRQYRVPDFGTVLLTDTQGFEKDLSDGNLFGFMFSKQSSFGKFQKEVEAADVIFLVSNIAHQTQKPDRDFLIDFYRWCDANPQITPPILILIVTGMDSREELKTLDSEGAADLLDRTIQDFSESIHLRPENIVVPFFKTESSEGNEITETVLTLLRQMSTEILRIQEARKLVSETGRSFGKTAVQVGNLGSKLISKVWRRKNG